MLLHLSLFCLLLQELLSPTAASDSGILGGKIARPHSRPYMASLQVRGAHTCGGFLIREDFILTAAHCTYECKQITVVLGGHNISKIETSQQRIAADKCHRHGLHTLDKNDFDIALIKLMKNATLNKRVNYIKLPSERGDIPDHTKCLIPGWGRTKPGGAAAKILHEVSVSIESSKQCRKMWQRYFQPSRMLCTLAGKKGICQGDSGGPLVYKDKAYGIAVLTEAQCSTTYPNIHMKVPYFITWIKEKMNEKY